MSRGYFLRLGDKTTCGGKIISACEARVIQGVATARVGDKYICGVDGKEYSINTGIPDCFIASVHAAGSEHSNGTCPCNCSFIPSNFSVSYGYESEHRILGQAPDPSSPVSKTAPPSAPTPEEEPRTPVDAGFCVLPNGSTPAAYSPYFFVNPPADVTDLYHALNPNVIKKPGSILIVVDPLKQEPEQIKELQKARDRVDAALAPLTTEEAKLLYENRAAVDMFSSQVYSDALSTSGDILGFVNEAGKSYYEEINNTLKEIQLLYHDTYNHNGGVISGQEFFGQRKRLFEKLNVALNRYSKSQLGLNQYQNIKKALGLSTSSIMHKWDQTGVSRIEGYANYIEKSAKLMKIMRTTGYVGIGLDFSAYSNNVYDACAMGREDACKKAAIVEYSKFGGKQVAGATAGWAAGLASRGACMWLLGLSTAELGGIGSAMCFVTGLGFSIGASKLVEGTPEEISGDGGNIIYEHYFK